MSNDNVTEYPQGTIKAKLELSEIELGLLYDGLNIARESMSMNVIALAMLEQHGADEGKLKAVEQYNNDLIQRIDSLIEVVNRGLSTTDDTVATYRTKLSAEDMKELTEAREMAKACMDSMVEEFSKQDEDASGPDLQLVGGTSLDKDGNNNGGSKLH